MSVQFQIKRFVDGAIPVYIVVEPVSGHPYTNGENMPWQSISPDLLRALMVSVMPGAVEVAPAFDEEMDRSLLHPARTE